METSPSSPRAHAVWASCGLPGCREQSKDRRARLVSSLSSCERNIVGGLSMLADR